jgi:hypothetical protein
LASTLLGVARQTADDSAARYVLLTEARTLAVDAANVGTLRDVLLSLVNGFEVNEPATFVDAWNELLKRPRDTAVYRGLFDEANTLFDEAVMQARFNDAQRYGGFLTPTAGRLKDQALTKLVNEKNAALVARRKEWETVQAAADKLKATPDDVGANLTIGRYLALTAGEWSRAFPYLAKCGDPVFQDLATKAAGVIPEPNAQLIQGDAWWEAAQAAKPPQRNELLVGANYWYAQAAPLLSGIQRSRVDKRLSDSAAYVPQRKLPATRLDLGGEAEANRGVVPTRGFGDP